MLDLKTIKPKTNNKSEKFSIYLYRFIKNWRKERASVMPEGDVKIYSDGKNYFIGHKTTRSNFIGRRIKSICGGARGYKESYAYTCKDSENLIEVTDAFFVKYLEIGKCTFGHGRDKHYWHNFEESSDGELRTCSNCGLTLKKKIEKVEQHITTWEII